MIKLSRVLLSHTRRSTFCWCGGGYYLVASDTGLIPTETQFPCQTLAACLFWSAPRITYAIFSPCQRM